MKFSLHVGRLITERNNEILGEMGDNLILGIHIVSAGPFQIEIQYENCFHFRSGQGRLKI